MVPLADRGCRAREMECRSVLNKSGLADYAVNYYAGCEHGCVYCYARFATRFSHAGEPWGSFVDVKVNAARVLAHEAKRKRVGRVFISSVCDGWQPLEASYYLTSLCIIKNRLSRESRGFGFLKMLNKTEALEAIRGLNSKELKGQPLTVDEAWPRREDRRGGGRPGNQRPHVTDSQ